MLNLNGENKMEEYNRNPENRPMSSTGAENRAKSRDNREKHDNRAEIDGKKGDFRDDWSEPTGETSAIPGANEKKDIGDKAAGAGLGGNKGRGTRTPGEFD